MSTNISTNLAALRAQDYLTRLGEDRDVAMERLSSGKRINSAKDDAAGLAITDRMTADIKGLEVATRNSLDAISMAQTAEGNLREITNILQRMRELAMQAANGTLSTQNKKALQLEVNQLYEEIGNISDAAVFNGVRLLNGESENPRIQVGTRAGDTIIMGLQHVSAGTLGLDGQAIGRGLISGRVGLIKENIDASDIHINSQNWSRGNGLNLDDAEFKDSKHSGWTGDLKHFNGALKDAAKVLAKKINSAKPYHEVTAKPYNTLRGMVPAVSTFAKGLVINGKEIGAASTVEDYVKAINRDAPGITAILNGDGTITLSNDTGEDIVIKNGKNNRPAATDFGFEQGIHTGFLSLKAEADKPINLKANTSDMDLGGDGTVDDVQKLGFNETKGLSETTGHSVMGSVDNSNAIKNTDMIKINGIKVPSSVDSSAMAKAHAINKITEETKVVASARTDKKYALDFRNFTETSDGAVEEKRSTIDVDIQPARMDRLSFNLGESYFALDKRHGVTTDLDYASASLQLSSTTDKSAGTIKQGDEKRLSFSFDGHNYVADKRSGVRVNLKTLSDVRAFKIGNQDIVLTAAQIADTKKLAAALNSQLNGEYVVYRVDNDDIEIRAKSGKAVSPEIIKLGAKDTQKVLFDTSGLTNLTDIEEIEIAGTKHSLKNTAKVSMNISALRAAQNAATLTIPTGKASPTSLNISVDFTQSDAAIQTQINNALTSNGVSMTATVSGNSLELKYTDANKFNNLSSVSISGMKSGVTAPSPSHVFENSSVSAMVDFLNTISALKAKYSVKKIGSDKIEFHAKNKSDEFTDPTTQIKFLNGSGNQQNAAGATYGYTANSESTNKLASVTQLKSIDFDLSDKAKLSEKLREMEDIGSGEILGKKLKYAKYNENNNGKLELRFRTDGALGDVKLHSGLDVGATVSGTDLKQGDANDKDYIRLQWTEKNSKNQDVTKYLDINVGKGSVESRVRKLNENSRFKQLFEAHVVDGDTIDIRFKNKKWTNADRDLRIAWHDDSLAEKSNINSKLTANTTKKVDAVDFDENSLTDFLKGTNGKSPLTSLADDGRQNKNGDLFSAKLVSGRLKLEANNKDSFSGLLIDADSVRAIIKSYVKPENATTGTQLSINGVKVNMVGVRDLASLVKQINSMGITGIKAEADEKTGKLALISNTGQNIVVKAWSGKEKNVGNDFLEGVKQAARESDAKADRVYGRITLKSQKGVAIRVEGHKESLKKVGLSAQGGENSHIGGGLSIENNANADEALRKLDSALTKVGEIRANLGAVQNRVQKTMNNLRVTRINMAAARSRIMDTDFSVESTNLTRANVLTQAAQSMLAQANKQPEQVLKLLR